MSLRMGNRTLRAHPILTCAVSRVFARNPTSTGTSKLYASSQSGPLHEITVDQTKRGNDPKQDKKQDHKFTVNMKEGPLRDRDDVMQPSAQQGPQRSTGILSEGPQDVKAGKGTDEEIGKVHKETTPGKHMAEFDR